MVEEDVEKFNEEEKKVIGILDSYEDEYATKDDIVKIQESIKSLKDVMENMGEKKKEEKWYNKPIFIKSIPLIIIALLYFFVLRNNINDESIKRIEKTLETIQIDINKVKDDMATESDIDRIYTMLDLKKNRRII